MNLHTSLSTLQRQLNSKTTQRAAVALVLCSASPLALAHGDFGALALILLGAVMAGVAVLAAIAAALAPKGRKWLWAGVFFLGIPFSAVSYFGLLFNLAKAITPAGTRTNGSLFGYGFLLFVLIWLAVLGWLAVRRSKARTAPALVPNVANATDAFPNTVPAVQDDLVAQNNLAAQNFFASPTRRIALGLTLCWVIHLPSLGVLLQMGGVEPRHFLFLFWLLLSAVAIVGLMRRTSWGWQLGMVWLALHAFNLLILPIFVGSAWAGLRGLSIFGVVWALFPTLATLVLLGLLLLPGVRKECGVAR